MNAVTAVTLQDPRAFAKADQGPQGGPVNVHSSVVVLFISHFRQSNYLTIQALHGVLKQLLELS